MKTTSTSKRLVSLLLAVIMVLSMMTVGMVTSFAAETDTAQTGATKTYYFGFTSWSSLHYAWFEGGSVSGNNCAGSFKDEKKTFSYDIGGTNGNLEYKVYSVTVDSSYTDAYITVANGNKYPATPKITLDSSKITLVTEWNNGAIFGQTAYSGGGETTDEFPIDFVEGSRTIYLVDEAGWGSSKCYAWTDGTSTSNATWPGVDMTDTGKTMNGYKIYSYTVGSAFNKVIFYNADTKRTGNLDFTQYGYYNNKTSSWSTKSPTTPPSGDPTTLETFYFFDNSSDQYMDDSNASLYATFDNGKELQMKQRVDTLTGNNLWSVAVPDNSTKVSVKRVSKLDGSTWGTWNNIPLSGKSNGFYKAISGGGSWEDDDTKFSPSSDDDIKNFWYGAWVDTKSEGNAHDAVRWWKDSSNEYHIFLPSHTPNTFRLYSSFKSITLNDLTATNGNYIELSNIASGTTLSGNYVPMGETSSTSLSITFHKSSDVSTLFLNTDDLFYTSTILGADEENKTKVATYKDGIETKGSIYLYSKDGALVNSGSGETKLKKIKGRGNSSFDASMRLYGKYAYNFNLDKNVSLIDDATKTKKWCLLANNVDHSMLRNTFAYSIAAELGLEYSPKTRHVDVYNMGEYIGAYTITEKVEYGEKSLMNGLNSLDDLHEAWYKESTAFDEDVDYDEVIKEKEVTNYSVAAGGTYNYKCWESDISGLTYNHGDDTTYQNTHNFLLEHELGDRYEDECSWFKSNRTGQHVVVKYPEYASEDEMKWIIGMYDKLEKAAYETKTMASIEAAIDVASFAKVYLIQELGLNLDSCATSYYIYNDRNTNKLVAGPVWDYDWSFGSYHKTKPMNDTSLSRYQSWSLDNPKQMFVRYKVQSNATDGTGNSSDKLNLQAQLTQTSAYWTECQRIWTNQMDPILDKYIDANTNDDDNTGVILGWLDQIEASVEMDNIRWNNYSNDEIRDWGTKLTSNYNKGSYDFKAGTGNSAGSASKCYANTVYYLNDWLHTRHEYMSSSTGGNLYNESLLDPIKLNSVTMNATQSGNTVTVNVAIDATNNNVQIENSQKFYDLYVNGSKVGTYTAADTATVTLVENVETEIYVVGYIKDADGNENKSIETEKQKFTYTVSETTVSVTIKFKSSSSVRYIPSIKVNGNTTAEKMTIGEEIGWNASGTQSYNWFTANVELVSGKATNITFTNSYSMNASVSVTAATDGEEFYFGVDNLNNGNKAVDLTDKGENIRNFVKSASHMVHNDVYDPAIATTSLGGTIYKLGDTDGDNKLTVIDATKTQMALVGKTELSATGEALADFNLDGRKSIMDVTLTQVYLTQ